MKGKNASHWSRREFVGGLGATLAWASAWPSGRVLGADLPVPGPADWPRFGYDLHNSRFNSREKTINPGNVGRLKPKWRYQVGAPMQTSPTVIGDTLFVGAWDGRYHALDTDTGERPVDVRCRHHRGASVESS